MSLEELLKQDAAIIDVRTSVEFNTAHANGSINIPLGEIMMHLEELKEMHKPIVLICASGNRSGQAAIYLAQNGLTEVYNGGSWLDINYIHSLNLK